MKLRERPHWKPGEKNVIEILAESGQLIGVIYPQPRGVKIISKHIRPSAPDLALINPGEHTAENPTVITVNITPEPR